jgi:hypothetical protein
MGGDSSKELRPALPPPPPLAADEQIHFDMLTKHMSKKPAVIVDVSGRIVYLVACKFGNYDTTRTPGLNLPPQRLFYDEHPEGDLDASQLQQFSALQSIALRWGPKSRATFDLTAAVLPRKVQHFILSGAQSAARDFETRLLDFSTWPRSLQTLSITDYHHVGGILRADLSMLPAGLEELNLADNRHFEFFVSDPLKLPFGGINESCIRNRLGRFEIAIGSEPDAPKQNAAVFFKRCATLGRLTISDSHRPAVAQLLKNLDMRPVELQNTAAALMQLDAAVADRVASALVTLSGDDERSLLLQQALHDCGKSAAPAAAAAAAAAAASFSESTRIDNNRGLGRGLDDVVAVEGTLMMGAPDEPAAVAALIARLESGERELREVRAELRDTKEELRQLRSVVAKLAAKM